MQEIEDLIGYDEIIENSMRSVIFETLKKIEKDGLPGKHYFVMTFLTEFPDVEIPKNLKIQYQEEMTIVVQYQYKDLKVEQDHFSINLSFNQKYESLKVPYKSITSFADPSMNFGLKFSVSYEETETKLKSSIGKKSSNANKSSNDISSSQIDLSAKVVSLDDFRKQTKNNDNNE